MADFYTLLEELCSIPAPSGAEESVRVFLIDLLKEHVDTMKLDRMGNLICFKKGKQTPEKPILLAAHMDEVGFIVTDITPEGYLKFGTVGGIEPGIMPAKRVRFLDQTTVGVISAKPIHLYKDAEELYQPTKRSSLYIDIGAKDREDAQKHVKIGDLAVFDRASLPYFDAGKVIRSAALDDRLGCAMLAELLCSTPPYDITVAFTVKEESGLRGATTVTYTQDFTYAIVLEGTTASDLPEAQGPDAVCFQGEGGALSLFDGATLYDRSLIGEAHRALTDEKIPVQFKRRLAGGNDAAALQRRGPGHKIISLSAPCRYIHSPVSTVAKADLDAMRKSLPILLSVCAKRGAL